MAASIYNTHSDASSEFPFTNEDSNLFCLFYPSSASSSSSSSSSSMYAYESLDRHASVPKSLYEYSVPMTMVSPSDRELGYTRTPNMSSTIASTSTFSYSSDDLPPPAYQSQFEDDEQDEKNAKKKRGVFGAIFSCLRRSRSTRSEELASPPPPPYVSAGDIALMEERVRQLDQFFGGAAL